MKKILILITILLLSACSSSLPNPYEPVYNGKNSFPSNGKGIVSVYFDSVHMGVPMAVATTWNKVNEDGTLGKDIRLTYNGVENAEVDWNNHQSQRIALMLEPGTYVLNKVSNGVSVGYTEDNPYDKKAKKSGLLMLKVKKGEILYYPKLRLSSAGSRNKEGKYEFSLRMLELKDDLDTTSWIYGKNAVVEDGTMHTERY